MNLPTLPDTLALLAVATVLALAGVAAAYVAVCTVVAQRFTRARRQEPATWLAAAGPLRLAAPDGPRSELGLTN